jgi:hypothetical protein
MKVLAFDLSTKTGWALFDNEKLICYGQLKSAVIGDESSPNYPQNYIDMANKMGQEVKRNIISSKPDYIVTEETNKGKNRYSQKQLEFIHFAVNTLAEYKIHYIDTSEWRSLLGITLDKEQRKDNRTINGARKDEFDKVFKICYETDKLSLQMNLSKCLNKREQNKVNKEYNKSTTIKAKQMMKSYRYKEEGKVVGKITCKTLSVNYVNERFSLQLKKKDNDVADAICIGQAFINKMKV